MKVLAQEKNSAGTLAEGIRQFYRLGVFDCIVCLGSPDLPVDAYGPLVGERLSGRLPVDVWGTMKAPVTAETVIDFRAGIRSRRLLAVDAAQTVPDDYGVLILEEGPLFPGRASRGRSLGPLGECRLLAGTHLFGVKLEEKFNPPKWLIATCVDVTVEAFVNAFSG